MKKKRFLVVFLILVVLILLTSFASASWLSDLFKKIAGNLISVDVYEGYCIVGSGPVSLPSLIDPDVGPGYAKKYMGRVSSDFSVLKQQCTDAIFKELMQTYCQSNTEDVSWGVVLFKNYQFYSSGSPLSGSGRHYCGDLQTSNTDNRAVCIVRDGYDYHAEPSPYDPDVGLGYAKKHIYGTNNNISILKQQCTDIILKELMQKYCELDTNPAQWGVEILGVSSTGAASGNGLHYCQDLQTNNTDNRAICLVRSKYHTTLIAISPYDPDVGDGYAKKHIYGTNNNLSILKQKCTDAVFKELMQKYCETNTDPANWEVVSNLGLTGGYVISGYHYCQELQTQDINNRAACLVIGEYTRYKPSPYDPDIGTGYVKKHFPEAGNNLSILIKNCTNETFKELMQTYCQSNTERASWSAILLGTSTGIISTSLGNWHYCQDLQTNNTDNRAICDVGDGYTSISSPYAPDVGLGYAKKHIYGTNNNLSVLKQKCTDTIFRELMQKYCEINMHHVQWSASIIDHSTTCAASGCQYRYCPCIGFKEGEKKCSQYRSPALFICRNNQTILLDVCTKGCTGGVCSGGMYNEGLGEYYGDNTGLTSPPPLIGQTNISQNISSQNISNLTGEQIVLPTPTILNYSLPSNASIAPINITQVPANESQGITDNKTTVKINDIEVKYNPSELEIVQEKQEAVFAGGLNETGRAYIWHKRLGGNIELKITPEQAIALAKEMIRIIEIHGIELQEFGDKIVYTIDSEAKAKILGFIGTKTRVITMVNINTGKIVKIKKPWWSFLASGV